MYMPVPIKTGSDKGQQSASGGLQAAQPQPELRYTVLRGSAQSPVDPWAASAAIYGSFGPLDAQRQAVQQYFAAGPYAGFQAAQWGFRAPLADEQRMTNALRLVEDTLRRFGGLPPAAAQGGQQPALAAGQAPATFGSEFIQSPNVAADIVRQLLDYKPMSVDEARNFMRLARAMGPQNALAYGVMTGKISPGMAGALMGGPMPILAALPAVSSVDAARLQAMGQAMPAAYQAMAQLALAPLTAEITMADRRLAAAELLQRPYMEGMRGYGAVAPQLLGAAATAPIMASDFLSRHQALALQSLSQLAQPAAAAQ